MNDCQTMLSLKHDAEKLQNKESALVKAKEKCSKRNLKPCFICGKLHLRKDCSWKMQNVIIVVKKRINQIAELNQEKILTEKLIHNIVTEKIVTWNKRKFVKVQFSNVRVKMLLDTGNDISIVNDATWKEIGKPVY